MYVAVDIDCSLWQMFLGNRTVREDDEPIAVLNSEGLYKLPTAIRKVHRPGLSIVISPKQVLAPI